MHSDRGLQRMCVLRRNLVKKNKLLFANTYEEQTAFFMHEERNSNHNGQHEKR